MKQNQQDYGVWEVKSCRLADCTNKEQVNVSPCLWSTLSWKWMYRSTYSLSLNQKEVRGQLHT